MECGSIDYKNQWYVHLKDKPRTKGATGGIKTTLHVPEIPLLQKSPAFFPRRASLPNDIRRTTPSLDGVSTHAPTFEIRKDGIQVPAQKCQDG